MEERKKKEKEGKVVSISGEKSVLVEVSRRVRHPVYGKIVTKRKKFMVHNDSNEAKIGDIVTFIETRPLSKRKRWKIIDIVKMK
ncbi:MAG: 30S ribosomal protein S17 [Candidatus Cloacimonadota bacterium]|nr:MAG: 30S ribosomal protein S17 [Candidatus Cloacimonadota bacterium]